MPFTFAHPIAAAPIWFGSKKRLDLPSLFVGTMIPDVDYFLALKPLKTIGHDFPGILIQGIPASLVLLMLTRYVLMRPFFALLPEQLARRFPPSKRYFPLRILHLINIIISVAIGATSHLIWDTFTHVGDSVAIDSPLLESMVGSLPIYKLLQYGSGIFGVVALSYWLFIWLNQSVPSKPVETLAPLWRAVVILGMCLSAVGFAGLAIESNRMPSEPFPDVVVRGIIGSISGLFIGLLLYSIVFWLLNSFKPNSTII